MKKYKLKNLSIVLTTLIVLVMCVEINSTIRYVSKTGNSTPPYLTWETAADSIQKCINISVFGDTIYVANGVYQEQVVMIPGLSLIGSGADSCEINTKPFATTTSYRSVVVNDYCLFKGFKIVVANNTELGVGIGGTAINSIISLNKITEAKYGIDNGSNVFIYNNIIENISSGIYLFNSDALVRRNIIYTDPNSQSVIIGGIRVQAFNNNYYPVIDSNHIETIGEGIRKSINSRPTIKNNTIVLKSLGGVGMWLSSSDSAKVYNNLIIAEAGWQGILNNGTQYLLINNNYVTGYLYSQQNTDYGLSLTSYNQAKNNVVTEVRQGVNTVGTQNLIYKHNNVWDTEVPYIGFIPDTTNLSVDPMVVNDDTTQGELDFHLQKYSPLIDAGDPTILDRDGSRSDIGLFGGPYGESYVYVDLPPRPPVNLTVNVDSLIELKWNRNAEADFNHYNLYRDTTNNFQIDSTKLVASLTDTFYIHIIPTGIESLYFKITGVDNQGNESNPSEEVGVLITSVEDEWKPVNNYILYQNFPNPFNPSTKISYKLKERGYVKLYVYDIRGELISVLVNDVQESGYYEVEFNASSSQHPESSIKNLASGVYIYQILVSNDRSIPVFSDIKKMVYVK